MKVYKIIFSPTGGTEKAGGHNRRRVGRRHCCHQTCQIRILGLFKGQHCNHRDALLWRTRTEVALNRLSEIKGNNTKTVVVCVYGNRAYEDTLVEMSDRAEEAGFKVEAAVAAVAEHSIIHQYAAGPPNTEKDLRRLGKQISDKLRASAESMGSFRATVRIKRGLRLVPKATKDCVKCGLCAKNCPAGAISKSDVTVTDSEKCVSSMQCMVKCPKSARKVDEAVVSMVAAAIKEACSERKNNGFYVDLKKMLLFRACCVPIYRG